MRIAAIASTSDREKLLERTIYSLYNQVNHIYLFLNNYITPPSYVKDENITYILGKNEYGDAGKFFWANKVKAFYFPCDDDIIYPSDYCDIMQGFTIENECVITLQGRNFEKFPIYSYYHRAQERTFCMFEQVDNLKVMFGGTGVMCFNTEIIKVPDISYFRKRNMADIWMGLWCMENNIPIISVSHAEDWIKLQSCKGIWDKENNKDWKQTLIINEFFKKKV